MQIFTSIEKAEYILCYNLPDICALYSNDDTALSNSTKAVYFVLSYTGSRSLLLLIVMRDVGADLA